ncbi:hypothetical protein SmJEL517_g06185 [Synchytrium microbalum]|uniref:RNA helicase n=1 Tax=Synchytrium microbalum TaxID=1806994 RepID=A0A507BXX8_9FUNG|nr:uncharacterized protein SmJEL517_g06185 [Synchytrium microbalum]TPX30195.1 hypothetical protein SmJEL517_g06185 [Synchytrium microbalum]
MGFSGPSKIQEKALPLLLATPRNMIGQSQSGTGTKAVFVLTMLSGIEYAVDRPQALCLAPTQLSCYDFKSVNVFVLNEVDNMLDQPGLGEQSLRIRRDIPRTAQILFFSATFTPEIREFACKFPSKAHVLSLKPEEMSIDGIKQFYMKCKDELHKIELLQDVYGFMTIGQSIIFVKRRETADLLSKRMIEAGHTVIHLRGGMSPEDRDDVMDDFRKGRAKVLISTNVIARGIAVLQETLVVNFDMPLDAGKHKLNCTGLEGRDDLEVRELPSTIVQ